MRNLFCFLDFVGVPGLATPQSATASLNAFPVLLAAGALKTFANKKDCLRNLLLFSTPLLASKLAPRHKKQKDVFRHLLVLSVLSGYQDSNLGPPAPKAGALTGLRYTPNSGANIRNYLQFATICTDIISLLPPLFAICRYPI